jgi:hypothetical protein
MNDPRLLRLANLYQLVAAGILAVVMLAALPAYAIPVAAGGVLMAANFYFLRLLVSRTLQPGGMRALYAVGLMLKFFAVMGIMAALLLGAKLDPVGFAIGLGSLFLGLMLAMVHQALLAKPSAAKAVTGI